jgi:ATP/maltotriose-dependent transcriptional regulator MalT
VDWLESIVSDRVMEFEEIRGYHLEQAYLILVQLAPADDHVRGLGIRGARYLSSAGRRALARGDMPAASSLLRRAAGLLPPGDAERPRLLLDAGEALTESGELSMAETVLTAGIDEARELGERGLEITGRMILLDLKYATAPETAEEDILAEAERAIPVLEELGDHEGQARAWRLVTLVNWEACRWGASEAAAQRMIEHARLAGDGLLEARVLPALATCALYGPRPVSKAIEICTEILERTGTDRKAAAVTVRALAHLEAMRGNFEQARDLYRQSRASLEELGWKLHAAVTSLSSGPIEMLAGDAAAAEAELRADHETLEGMGEKYYLSTNAAFLAEALYRQERLDEAAAFCQTSKELASPDDISSQFAWRSVMAKVLARRGELDEAERLAHEAVALIGEAEEPDSQATAAADLGEVLIRVGKPQDAETALEQATFIYEAKGNVVAAERTRRRLEELRLAREGSVPL